jgi:hypothetical protein
MQYIWAVVSFATWIVVLFFLYHRTKKALGAVGLTFSYLACNAVIILPGALVGLLDLFNSDSEQILMVGLPISAMMPIGIIIGHILRGVIRSSERSWELSASATQTTKYRSTWLAGPFWVFFFGGLLLFAVGSKIMDDIPTLSSLPSMGLPLATTGIVGVWWCRYHGGREFAASRVLPLVIAIPTVTLLGHGFLSVAILPIILTFSFVSSIVSKRVVVTTLILSLVLFGFVSVPTYFKYREELRDSVWGGENVSQRIDKINSRMVDGYVMIDGSDASQFTGYARLNHANLLGQIKLYMEHYDMPFGWGITLTSAAIAPIPRVLWPDKPTTAGGSKLVTHYTGVFYNDSTSVGITHIGELYVNFGMLGVFLGGALFGWLFTWLDQMVVLALHDARPARFVAIFFPVQTLMGVTSGFSEMMGGVMVSIATFGILWWIQTSFRQKLRQNL